MNIIPYGRQNIDSHDIEAVSRILNSDFLTQGPAVEEFENAFAKYIGSTFAIAVSNGTAALHLCNLALDVNENSNVITSPITFAASANSVRYCNGNIFFADIDPETLTLDPEKVVELIESKPKGFFQGIIPVDLAGYPVNLEAFRKIADKYGLWIIEDACHAPGGWFTDSNNVQQNCGNGVYADLAIFSFHPVKHIACGEGGMVTTNDKALYERIKMLRTHGITKDPKKMKRSDGGWYYEMQELGFNYRMPDILCALGTSQLKKADEGIAKRKVIAKKYDDELKHLNLELRSCPFDKGHAYHLYIIETNKRAELYEFLKQKGIYCQVHYIPVHKLPYYEELYGEQHFINAENYYNRGLSLPMYPGLSIDEQDFVIQCIKDFYE